MKKNHRWIKNWVFRRKLIEENSNTARTTRTGKILNSRTANDSQGLVRTCQVLDQSLQVPLLALKFLDQSLPVLGNPGDTLPRTGRRKKSKTDSGVIRA